MDVIFSYDKLRRRIKERLGTQDRFAKEIGLGRVSVSQSLNNQREFSAGEMFKSAQVLGFSIAEIPAYFFTEKVQKREQPGDRRAENEKETLGRGEATANELRVSHGLPALEDGVANDKLKQFD